MENPGGAIERDPTPGTYGSVEHWNKKNKARENSDKKDKKGMEF